MFERPPDEMVRLEQVERQEAAARLNLKAAREQAKNYNGEVPREHHELIQRLETEWKHAAERLHRARQPPRE